MALSGVIGLTRRAAIDGQVIEACRQGDREAFRQVFDAYRDRVFSLALHLAGSEAAAKDVTQQVFLTLFTRAREFRGDAQLTTWLYRLAINASIDERRRQRRLVPVVVAPVAVERTVPEDALRRRELAGYVRAALERLSPKLRVVVVLKHLEGLSYDEMAQVLGCSPGTVASRLNRGHKALARALAHLEGETD